MSLATADELATYLGTTFADDTRAEMMLDLATGKIQDYVRQTIEQVSGDVVKLKGNWTSRLHLPEIPVSSVASVVVNGTTYTAGSDYTFDGIRTLYRGAVDFTVDAADLTWADTELHWGGPDLTITVTYTHGYATIPNSLKGICLAMAARGMVNPVNVASESVGQYAVSYSPGLELTRVEKKILDDWRRRWLGATS